MIPDEAVSALTMTDDGDEMQGREGERSEFSRGLPVTYKNFANRSRTRFFIR